MNRVGNFEYFWIFGSMIHAHFGRGVHHSAVRGGSAQAHGVVVLWDGPIEGISYRPKEPKATVVRERRGNAQGEDVWGWGVSGATPCPNEDEMRITCLHNSVDTSPVSALRGPFSYHNDPDVCSFQLNTLQKRRKSPVQPLASPNPPVQISLGTCPLTTLDILNGPNLSKTVTTLLPPNRVTFPPHRHISRTSSFLRRWPVDSHRVRQWWPIDHIRAPRGPTTPATTVTKQTLARWCTSCRARSSPCWVWILRAAPRPRCALRAPPPATPPPPHVAASALPPGTEGRRYKGGGETPSSPPTQATK